MNKELFDHKKGETNVSFDVYSEPFPLWKKRVFEEFSKHLGKYRRSKRWDISNIEFSEIKEFVEDFAKENMETFFGENQNSNDKRKIWGLNKFKFGMVIKYTTEDLTITTYSSSKTQLDQLFKKYHEQMRERLEKDDPNIINLSFTIGEKNRRGMEIRKKSSWIKCPEWKDIQNNYPENKKLDGLHKHIKKNRGKLIIWHGPTGTGKTWAIKSLIREQKDNLTPLYITDKDKFVHDIDYYYEVISDFSGDSRVLFILEDMGKFLLPDAREDKEEQFSKILNLTDGLLSSGRDDLFLITFNEDVDEIDSAIKRPGRCYSAVYFPKFKRKEAINWLENHDLQEGIPDKDEFSLADLYELIKSGSEKNADDLEKIEQKEEKTIRGFDV